MGRDIETQVKEIIAGVLDISVDEIQEDTAIGDFESWDSLHHLQIISTIENRFGFRFTPNDMMELEDVDDIVNAIKIRVDK